MNRDLKALQSGQFDLVVIGGGVFGVCAAWDAAQRGLSVAIIDRSDFGAATSANSYKIVHGGIRYVQHGDVPRVRKSSAERRAFLRLAPHLVHPLPIAIPTYGHAMKGRLALRAGMGIYDALTPDKDRGIDDPERTIGWGKMMSRGEILDLFPGVARKGLTGAALISDGQMYNPPRLVLALLKSAVACGAVAANHVEAVGLLKNGGRIEGVEVRDVLADDSFEIRGRVVLNAAGPYAEHFLRKALDLPLVPRGAYSRDACFAVPRAWAHPSIALAVQAQTRDPDALLSRGERHLFAAPWRGHTLIGTWHKLYHGDPDQFSVTDDEIECFVREFNAGYPSLNLSVDDVSIWNAGLVPFGQHQDGSPHLRYGHRSRLVDHAKADRLDSLISLIGVRFTTGRWEAEKAVDLVFRKLGSTSPRSKTSTTRAVGGDIPAWAEFTGGLTARYGTRFEANVLESLAHNYGSEIDQVVSCADDDPALCNRIGRSVTIGAQVRFAIRREMAQTLSDVVFRRTDMATGEYPGRVALEEVAQTLVEEGRVTASAVPSQIAEVQKRFRTAEIRRIDAPEGR